jgi:hypothetical protein
VLGDGVGHGYGVVSRLLFSTVAGHLLYLGLWSNI